MKTIITIVCVILAQVVCAQDTKSDSTAFERNLDRFINREFFSLDGDEHLTALEAKYGTPLNSLAKCLVTFSRGKLNEDEIKGLRIRVQQIAKAFYDEGTPIYLSIGGMNSAAWTANQNKIGHRGNLTFVSLGNYCVVEKGETEFESIFNKKTLELLGIESLE